MSATDQTQEKTWKMRGTGIRYTVRFVGVYMGLWILLGIAAVAMAGMATYWLYSRAGLEILSGVAAILVVQAAILLVGVVGLAVWTTHRVAGPWIAVRRAMLDVKNGDLDRRLVMRRSDEYLADIQDAFNGMMESLNERMKDLEAGAGPSAPGESGDPASDQ